MNEYFKRDSARRRDTKWFLCPLYKAVSHAAASPTLVSHKSKAASLCWEGESSTGKVLCVYVCFQERERNAWGRELTDRKSVRRKTEVQVARKRAKENVWAVSKTGTAAWTCRLSHLCVDQCRDTIIWLLEMLPWRRLILNPQVGKMREREKKKTIFRLFQKSATEDSIA